jgi:hypothetical protein
MSTSTPEPVEQSVSETVAQATRAIDEVLETITAVEDLKRRLTQGSGRVKPKVKAATIAAAVILAAEAACRVLLEIDVSDAVYSAALAIAPPVAAYLKSD